MLPHPSATLNLTMPIPATLIAPLQNALAAEGMQNVIAPDGTLNPAALLAGLYDSVEFRSSVTPTIAVDLVAATASGPPNPLVAWLQPTVTLYKRDGSRTTIAPYGAAGEYGWLGSLVLVGALVGVGVLIGRR